MMKSLYSGVAGLKAHQTKMDTIGNNIANVNTYGFKSSRTTFTDVFYQTLTGSTGSTDVSGGTNSTQVGSGSMISSIDVLHTRAGYSSTGRSMDVYINGEGYLIAQDSTGSESYTRVGILSFDGSGNLVDSNGSYIVGYPITRDTSGSIVYGTKAATAATATAGDLEIGFGLNSTFNDYTVSVVHATGADSVAAAIDTDAHTIVVTVTSADTTTAVTAAAVQAALLAAVPSGADATAITAALTGITATTASAGLTVADILTASAVAVSDGNAETSTNSTMIDTSGAPTIITKPGSLSDTNSDGTYDTESEDEVIDLTNITIGSDGIISGTDTNGNIIFVGQIAIANISNPEGLTQSGNSYYTAGNNTGTISYEYPGQGVSGELVSSGLEMSNVELSTEMAEMITTQRGFQANSRIITVADTMLEELINLKR